MTLLYAAMPFVQAVVRQTGRYIFDERLCARTQAHTAVSDLLSTARIDMYSMLSCVLCWSVARAG